MDLEKSKIKANNRERQARNRSLKSDDEIDAEIYSKLIELDARLGTTASEQLFVILCNTTRSDIIKVCNFSRTKDVNCF